MFPKQTPAERREDNERKYSELLRRNVDKYEANVLSLAKYLGAMNATFAIGSAAFIARSPVDAEALLYLKVIFVIAIIGVVSGMWALLRIVKLSRDNLKRFRQRWFMMLSGQTRRGQTRPEAKRWTDHDAAQLPTSWQTIAYGGRLFLRALKGEVIVTNKYWIHLPGPLSLHLWLAILMLLMYACAVFNSMISIVAVVKI